MRRLTPVLFELELRFMLNPCIFESVDDEQNIYYSEINQITLEHILAAITWDVDPEIFYIEFLNRGIRWYGLLFATGFFLAYQVSQKMFKVEKLPQEWLDLAFLYIFIATLIGARLGHVFFYEWDYYKDHIIEIPQIWKGGLASHGAAIAIIIALWLFSRNVTQKSMLWIIDRATLGVALAGAFIRTGNLMNSEIIGKPADVPWAFVFTRVDTIPRHPTQIYEALAYLAVFGILAYLFFRTNARNRLGMLSGVFFIGVFGARILIEFLKENQVSFEDQLALNMGQYLSIPLVLLGVGLLIFSLNRAPAEPDQKPPKHGKKTGKSGK